MKHEPSIEELLAELTPKQIEEVVGELPADVVEVLNSTMPDSRVAIPASPLDQALELDSAMRTRLHLTYLSDRLARAVEDVENGHNRKLMISMPPRSGKSTLSSIHLPTWLLRKHPEWKIGLISHSPNLATSWGRATRDYVEQNRDTLGIELARDGGAASEWATTAKGGVVSRSIAESVTGLGFKVLLLDDLVKDFASAHSPTQRQAVWDWWVSTSASRVEPPYLIVAIGTRWHEDDFLGRLKSREYPGNPDDWEDINFPAIAEGTDVLGREPGEPLYTPLLEESREEALERWSETKGMVGSYSWSALYQQRPAPAEGAVFDIGWFRYWTTNPGSATNDGRVVYLDPTETDRATWVDSWDFTFKDSKESDFVVGQRWVKIGANRFLIAQKRGRWSFSHTLEEMKMWASSESAYGDRVRLRLVEEKANGAAIINMLRDKVSGLKPINPKESKEARARASTPEIESGNVFLPYPADPGNEWVADFISEVRNFPHDAHDDQVDAMTQALNWIARGNRQKRSGIKATAV